MDGLPELPFVQILSLLRIEDLLKSRAVSRGWYQQIDRFRMKTLCFSMKQSDFIFKKRRWVSGSFVQNFISSPRFAAFFTTFGQTILSNLKHLRLCDLRLNKENQAVFACFLNSFSQLEALDIIRFDLSFPYFNMKMEVNLPMLHSIHLEEVQKIKKLTLSAPRLKRVKIWRYFSELELVYGDSVERLLLDALECTAVKKLKNLQYLYTYSSSRIDSTLLSSLEQLKEMHLQNKPDVLKFFEQKQRYGRDELKIYFRGLLLSGPEDPRIPLLRFINKNSLPYLVENPSALSDEIPFYYQLYYDDIEQVGLGLDILKKFTDLKHLKINHPVQDTQRFLEILKNLKNNIESLEFVPGQPQDLFDQLPEHSTVQKLRIYNAPSDLRFLFRLRNLIHLTIDLSCSIDVVQTVRQVLEELPFLLHFLFWYNRKSVTILINHLKQFTVTIDCGVWRNVADLNGSMQFIEETLPKTYEFK